MLRFKGMGRWLPWALVAFLFVAFALALFQMRKISLEADSMRNDLARLGKDLPDLVISDITYDHPNLYVSYANQGGGSGPADFLVKISNQRTGKSFDGNHYYRFKVPPPGQGGRTGGFNLWLIGFEEGTEGIVTAEIDWEGRVRELNESNNVFHKQLRFGKLDVENQPPLGKDADKIKAVRP